MTEISVAEDLYLHIREALHKDFEKLLGEFKAHNSVRFEQFAEKWKQMQMSLIFYGHNSEPEAREFTEEAFRQAWQFTQFTNPSAVFLEQVGSVYLLYSLYQKQVCEPKVKIRVDLNNWKHLTEFVGRMKEQGHTDFEYIFTRMKLDRAFHFVCTPQQMVLRMKSERNQTTPNSAPPIENSLISELLEPDTIDQLSAIHEQYYQMKCDIAGGGALQPSPSLNLINNDLIQSITKCVTKYRDKCRNIGGSRGRRKDAFITASDSDFDSLSEPEQVKESESPGKSRARVRAKAFAQDTAVSRSRRHRIVCTEESESPVKSAKASSPAKRARNEITDKKHENSKESGGDFHGDTILSMPKLTGSDEEDDDSHVPGKSPKKRRKKSTKKSNKQESKQNKKETKKKTQDTKKKTQDTKKKTQDTKKKTQNTKKTKQDSKKKNTKNVTAQS